MQEEPERNTIASGDGREGPGSVCGRRTKVQEAGCCSSQQGISDHGGDKTFLQPARQVHPPRLVRPHLEYGNIVWGPFNRSDQLLVERVQRRATKLVWDIRHLPYQDRLKSLKLPSLRYSYRRRRGDMITVYQLLHGKMDLNPDDFLHRASARETRGRPWRLAKPQAVTRVATPSQ